MFGMAQEMDVGFMLWIKADAARGGEAFERGARSLLAEVAGDGRGELLDRYRRTPQAKAG